MQTNTQTVRRFFQAVERRDLPAMLECYHPEVEIHESDDLPYGGVYRGHDGARAHALAFMDTWGRFQAHHAPSLNARFQDGPDGTVTAVFFHRATDPSTGLELTGDEVGVYELRGGQIVRSQMFHFNQGALRRFLAGDASPPGHRKGMELPIACSLEGEALEDRVAIWQRLADDALRGQRDIPGGVALTYARTEATEATVRELVRREAECCAWADWRVTSVDDQVRLEVTAAGDGEQTLRTMFGPGDGLKPPPARKQDAAPGDRAVVT